MSSLHRFLLRRTFCTSLPTPPQSKSNIVKTLSNDLFKERNLKRLVEKFKKSSENDRFRTKTGIYETTVRRLASAKRFRWIEEILEDQKKYRDISDEGFVVRLISLYGKSGMFDQACKLFDEMPDHKCERTVKSLNALLGACVNSKKYDKVEGYFRELPEKLGVKPDVVSYNSAIKAYCEMGSLDLALSMVDDMENTGLEPHLITFNILLGAFYGNGRFMDGEKIWARMEKKNVVPDIRSYNAKLVGLVSEEKISEAVDLVGEFGCKGLNPNVHSYNALIKGHCKDGNLEEAKRWYGEFSKNDCSADRSTFRTLIPFACEKGDLDWAVEMCKDVLGQRHLIDGNLLQLVVDELVKNSRIDAAEKLVETVKMNDYCRYKLIVPSC